MRRRMCGEPGRFLSRQAQARSGRLVDFRTEKSNFGLQDMERKPTSSRARTIHTRVKTGLQAILAAGIGFEIYEGHWLNATVVTGILLLTLSPGMLARRARISIPDEMELLAIAFIFAALFLGETRNYYLRFWWWDLALHATSGGLLGILGVLLVYVLNETPRIQMHMQPIFVAFFAFCFAVTVGALWEIFEFTMDQFFGMNMQKAMLNDPSGLTDTMWDLIVDTVGALAVSVAGYGYMRRGAESVVEQWIHRFVDENPQLFSRR